MSGLEDRKIDGVSTLLKLAQTLCRIKTQFNPIIAAKYPPDTPVGLLSAAVDGVCLLLPAATDSFYAPTGDNADILENPDQIPGLNPDAPAAPPTPEFV